MGNRQITNIPENNEYFSVSFSTGDKIRLIATPAEIIQQTETIVSSLWKIQDIHRATGFAEFKLKGFPLSQPSLSILPFGDANSLQFKYLLCNLIKYYYSVGWHIKCSPILQYHGELGSTIIFEKEKPFDTSVIAISFNFSDRIRFLGPDSVVPFLRETITRFWDKGIKEEKKYGESWEFELKGSPWSNSIFKDNECSKASILILELFRCFNKLNWYFCGSIYSGSFNQGLYFRYVANFNNSPIGFNYNDEYFALVLTGSDKLILVKPIPNLIELTTNIILNEWKKGIKYQKPLNENFYKIKMNGSPWVSSNEDRVDARKTFNSILGNLFLNNCELCAVCTYSERISTFFFKFNLSHPIPTPKVMPTKIFSLSLNSYDKIQIMENNQNLSFLTNLVRKAVEEGWPKGIQKIYSYYNTNEFKLEGYPFGTKFEYVIDISVLLMYLLKFFKENKINFVCSGDLSNYYYVRKTGENSYETKYEDLHQLFFHMD